MEEILLAILLLLDFEILHLPIKMLASNAHQGFVCVDNEIARSNIFIAFMKILCRT